MSRLFRRGTARGIDIAPVPDLAEHARGRGWEAVDASRPFDGHLEDAAHLATLSLRLRTRADTFVRERLRIGNTEFRDAYRFDVDGRRVTIANAWTNIQAEIRHSPDEWRGISVCAVELSTMLLLRSVQPSSMPALANVAPVHTGDVAFDERFRTVGAPGSTDVLTDEVRARISARDDWILWFERSLLGCFGKFAFAAASEVDDRVAEVLDLVAHLPADLVPTRVDHSHDELLARVSQLRTVDDALAFLQGLSPDERAGLAASDTPLAAFADVATPDEAAARLQSLDQQQRLELFAMFSRAKDSLRDP
jgi:hypothetical protein